VINYVDDILLLHQDKEYLTRKTQLVRQALEYFGFTMNEEKSEYEPKQVIIFLGWQWNLKQATVNTKPKKRLLLLHDLYNLRRWINRKTRVTVKQLAELIGKLNFLRLQFQQASLFLNNIDYQKSKAARMKG
jgi:hypothetical protein